MKKLLKTILHYDPQAYDEADRFQLHRYDMSSCGRVVIGEVAVEVEVPDNFNPIPLQVAALKAEQDRRRALFAMEMAQLDNQLAKLLCIEHVPQPEFSDDSGNAFA